MRTIIKYNSTEVVKEGNLDVSLVEEKFKNVVSDAVNTYPEVTYAPNGDKIITFKTKSGKLG
jgi:hypothetical protein